MKRLIATILCALPAFAQFANVPSTNYPALESILNAKPASRTGAGAPSGSCTAGKDFYVNTSTSPGTLYYCDASGHWTLVPLQVGYSSIQSAGSSVTARTTLNFGAEFTTVDNSGATRTDVSINGIDAAKVISGVFTKAQQHAATAYKDAGNVFTTGAQDFSAATSLRVPNAAGYTPTLNGHFGYDTTANAFKGYAGASVHTFAFLDSNVATATALAGVPSKCSAGNYPLGVDAQGNAQNCTAASAGSGNMTITVVSVDPTSAACTPGLTFQLNTTPAPPTLWQCGATSGTWTQIVTTSGTGQTYFNFTEGLSSGVATPASGDQRVFLDSADHHWKRKNSSGTVTDLENFIPVGGNAATATALASTPTLCTTGQAPTGILPNGNATGCAALGSGSAGAGAVTTKVGSYTLTSSDTGTFYFTGASATATLPTPAPATGWIVDIKSGNATGLTLSPNGVTITGCTSTPIAQNHDVTIQSDGTQYLCSATAPAATTVNGHALTGNVIVTAADLTLGSVTNDVQTKAAVVPNTAPAAGQMLVGNAGGTAYAPVTASGDLTIASTGAHTLATVNTNTGACGDATHVCQVTLDGKGRATAATAVTVVVPVGSGVSGLGANVAAFLAAPSGANFNSMIAAGGVPVSQNSQSAAYTTVLADGGKLILHPTADNNARTFTIDANATVAYPVGTQITFVNQINTLTIAITSDTLQLAGSATTGSRTLAAGGLAVAVKITSTLWFISGQGLT